jgi:hypothetical protein
MIYMYTHALERAFLKEQVVLKHVLLVLKKALRQEKTRLDNEYKEPWLSGTAKILFSAGTLSVSGTLSGISSTNTAFIKI